MFSADLVEARWFRSSALLPGPQPFRLRGALRGPNDGESEKIDRSNLGIDEYSA